LSCGHLYVSNNTLTLLSATKPLDVSFHPCYL
jgi:hypothetical protein